MLVFALVFKAKEGGAQAGFGTAMSRKEKATELLLPLVRGSA
jgi:hypothetical protein